MQEAAGASTIFVDVLWAMVVLVGCSMSLGGCMVAYRHFKAGGGGAPMYLPVQAAVSLAIHVCLFCFCSLFCRVLPCRKCVGVDVCRRFIGPSFEPPSTRELYSGSVGAKFVDTRLLVSFKHLVYCCICDVFQGFLAPRKIFTRHMYTFQTKVFPRASVVDTSCASLRTSTQSLGVFRLFMYGMVIVSVVRGLHLFVFLQEEVELSRRGGGAEQTPDVVRIG